MRGGPGGAELRDADAVFRALRAWSFELRLGSLERRVLKDAVVQEIERGTRLTGPELSRAEMQRTQLYHQVPTFMREYAFIVLPVAQVPPFDLDQPYVTEIEGVRMDSYIDWMKSCYSISVIGNPAISVPFAFYSRRITGGHPDRRKTSRRLAGPAIGARIRASDGCSRPGASTGVNRR